jgi:hypothetical protein
MHDAWARALTAALRQVRTRLRAKRAERDSSKVQDIPPSIACPVLRTLQKPLGLKATTRSERRGSNCTGDNLRATKDIRVCISQHWLRTLLAKHNSTEIYDNREEAGGSEISTDSAFVHAERRATCLGTGQWLRSFCRNEHILYTM